MSEPTVTVLMSYRLTGGGHAETLRMLGFSALWAQEREDFERLVMTHEIDVAIEWERPQGFFPVRDILRTKWPTVPVLLSLNWNKKLPLDFLNLGFADYLSVPYDMHELVQRVHNVLPTDRKRALEETKHAGWYLGQAASEKDHE